MTIALEVWIVGVVIFFGGAALGATLMKKEEKWFTVCLLVSALWPLVILLLGVAWVVEGAEYLIELRRIRRGRR